MRLAHIKLAGFKSFVDPTTIPVSQDLVGIVGPNGCGKSNIIDAVRWVLGESKASALRGDSMQDVIFAGSDQRKAVGRASVEIVFDNHANKASGQWASYSEIAIKRIVQRDGISSYYINNIQVRRRDISDLFLGTGVGVRGYAIIEQGMISRIIEAKPQELKSFLEEAAGITQYRERRQETSLRLVETRKNLTRLEDICRELESQLYHLAMQAEIATHYQSLQDKLHRSESLLWLQRKAEAIQQHTEADKEIQQLEIELENTLLNQRNAEQDYDTVRANEYVLNDKLLQAQGQLYSVNAEIGRIEQEKNFINNTIDRLVQQIQDIENRLSNNHQLTKTTLENLVNWQRQKTQAESAHAEYTQKNNEENNQLPSIEAEFLQHQDKLNECRHNLLLTEQTNQLEASHQAHATKNIQHLEARHARLVKEQSDLISIDSTRLNELKLEMNKTEHALNNLNLEYQDLEHQFFASNQSQQNITHHIQELQHTLSQATARFSALQNLQQELDDNHDITAWLNTHQLDVLPRLWQKIHILPEWENALEAMLLERLNSIEFDQLNVIQDWSDDLPIGKWAIFDKSTGVGIINRHQLAPNQIDCEQLLAYVTVNQPEIQPVLEDWLRFVYVIDNLQEGLTKRSLLNPGEILVTRQGHTITRTSITFYAPSSQLHGVLSRQQELKNIQIEIDHLESQLDEQRDNLEAITRHTSTLTDALNQSRENSQQLQHYRHDLQLEIVKLSQINERTAHRNNQINIELAEIKQALDAELLLQQSAITKSKTCLEQIDIQKELINQVQHAWESASQVVNKQRHNIQVSAQQLQEASSHINSCNNKINEIENKIEFLNEELQQLSKAHSNLLKEKNALNEEPLNQSLETAKTQRKSDEQFVLKLREETKETARYLQEIENKRMTCEQQSYSLRDAINQARLKEQAARITINQFNELINASNIDAQVLAPLLGKKSITGLQLEINRLNADITALGPVNLVALEEHDIAHSRQSELLIQVQDLNEAIATLENVIQQIDRETQLLLQQTFDYINKYLSEIFPIIFGGGQAKLELSDGKILDAGLLLMAQPPGKKNSSIHLLSGGEKALTALALIFSLFRLNPAPFCLLDEVDAPLDDSNTQRFCELVKNMSEHTQFLFISHNKITMEIAQQLIGVTMQEQGVSRIVAVDIADAMKMGKRIEQPVV